MAWQDEAVPMLRIMINDFGETPSYSDSRLTDILIVAAYNIRREVTFTNTYSVSIATKSISPDPISNDDDIFISLLVLKAACLADQSTFRTKALLEGVRAAMGPANIAISGNLSGFRVLLETGPCKAYQEMKDQQNFGGEALAMNVRAILTPFVSNQFDPSILQQSTSDRDRYS
jgi:hypothetical protein